MASFDRRQFIHHHAAALSPALLAPTLARGRAPGPTSASGPRGVEPDNGTVPGYFRFSLGEVRITILYDGHFLLPGAVGLEVPPPEFLALNVDSATREEYFESRFVPTDQLPFQANPVVLDVGGRRVLIDTGWSGAMAPDTTGHLVPALEAAGITTGSIETVVLTHGHPDHLGGLLDEKGGFRFPRAEVVISEAELALWTDDEAESRFREAPLPLPMIQGILRGVAERRRTIAAGDDVVPGLRSLSTPGHTAGHMSLVLEAGDREVLLTGDAIPTIHVHFERPDWHNLFDHEPERAAGTRRRLLDRAAADRMLMLGYHFPFPGIGYALRHEDAYRWYPATWTVLS
jgi:glyoxylase-like metal-dependent hydrolase (beta-lactamase superfamily II)